MTQVGPTNYDPIPIGEVAKPPFARLPDPLTIFVRRAERLRALAEGHELGAYLTFLADLSDVQHDVQRGPPGAELPAPDTIARARQFKMPPLDRSRFTPDVALNVILERIVKAADDVAMPEAARLALERIKAADPAAQAAMIEAVLSNAVPVEALGEQVFIAAALQVHFVRLAAQLDAKALVPVGQGACPVCGAAPVSSIVVGWSGAQNTRFCACSLCGTLWNYPRIKCTLCGSTKDIAYQEIAGGQGAVKAETCDSCTSYVKILHQHTNPSLDPVADDVATLGLDLLLREDGYRRGSFNPFLLGY
jgi:FdhE protein